VARLGLGEAVLSRLKDILRLSDEASSRLNYPGEGGERSFRGWLQNMMLIDLLKWPSDRVVVGERFDLLMRDRHGFPVVTIETKSPGHETTAREQQDFESRLSGYGTLQYAFITNGRTWERLSLLAPSGQTEVVDRRVLDVRDATPEQATDFFEVMLAQRYVSATKRVGRLTVNSANQYVLEALAEDLKETLTQLVGVLRPLFEGLATQNAGERPFAVVRSVFELWCEESNTVPPSSASARLRKFTSEARTQVDTQHELTAIGFASPDMSIARRLAEYSRGPRNRDQLEPVLWDLYSDSREKLYAQTAHVVIGRLLLYRVGEDKRVFPRALSGDILAEALQGGQTTIFDSLPATELAERIRSQMQELLPAVYKLGEFDWWWVNQEKRGSLDPASRSWLRSRDNELEAAMTKAMELLDGYFFAEVDIDVWRNVYQDYLPSEERQRLGGFYTPDELVSLVLDLADYKSECVGLCELSIIDPACGSGAFVTAATSRLLDHLNMPLACHSSIIKQRDPQWKRAEAILAIVREKVHAVDIHPFAAFLTTVNLLFLLLRLYAVAREKTPGLSLDLDVFSHDSLEVGTTSLLSSEQMRGLNSRIQRAEDSQAHYKRLLDKRFDRVFGNPPWGGILKGPLSPVYDEPRKARLRDSYHYSARGKYDIYGLFMERSLQMLRTSGRMALVTQDTFIDKEWARGLRELLASQTRIHWIVSLNPFGQLFFGAMNTPCITVVEKREPLAGSNVMVLRPGTNVRALSEARPTERRVGLTKAYLRAGQDLGCQGKATGELAMGLKIPQGQFERTAGDRWVLALEALAIDEGSWTASQLLDPSQGVTPGGAGVLEELIMSQLEAEHLGIEADFVRQVVKGLDVSRWSPGNVNKRIVYPYIVKGGVGMPAFRIADDEPAADLVRRMRQLGMRDALDFDLPLDDHEKEVMRSRSRLEAALELLDYRRSESLIHYPGLARFLVSQYERLESRVLKKRNIRSFNRAWYEFIWPRDPALMTTAPKLISPRLCRETRFALDTFGIVPQDSCVCLVPRSSDREWAGLMNALSESLGGSATTVDGLQYCLAFLNSEYATSRLREGQPTPKGSFTITDSFLSRVGVPLPGKWSRELVDTVRGLHESANGGHELEGHLAGLVTAIRDGAK